MSSMRRTARAWRLCKVVLVVVGALLAGCKTTRSLPRQPATALYFSKDDARHAIVALVEDKGTEPFTLSLPKLEAGEARHEGKFVVLGEAWRCDLDQKTFVFSHSSGETFYEIPGRFEWDAPREAWHAMLDR